jgi:sugar lactone lactonase YvrE
MQVYRPEVMASDFIFLEAPRWRDGALWVTDVFDRVLHKLDLLGNRQVILSDLSPYPNSVNFLPDGTPLIVSSDERKIMKIVGGKLETYADLSKYATGAVNDFAVDGEGRLYVGNFGFDIFSDEPLKKTSIHLVGVDGTVSVAASDMEFPNGTVIINGGRTLVVAETRCSRLTAFDRNIETGELSNRRLFADLNGRHPDGICADAEGAIWAPSFNTGEVVRVLDGGQVTDSIQFNGSAIACTVGGPDGHTLFCTTFDGTMEEQGLRKRLSKIFTVRVDAPAPLA